MKKTILGLFLGMSVMSMATEGGVKVGENVSGDLNINANVIAPLKIEEQTAMDFGDIVLGEAAASTTDGTMEVTGAKGNIVTVTVPGKATIKKKDQDGSDVEVTLSSVHSGDKQTLNENGNLIQTIHGTIAKEATKYTGTHTGTVTITVHYN